MSRAYRHLTPRYVFNRLQQLADLRRRPDAPWLTRQANEMLASLIRDAYARGLVPEVWKIEGTASAASAKIIDAAIRERAGPRQLILGKGADAASIAAWFDAAAGLESAAGFAIGRSVFMEPASAYLQGRMSEDAAIEAIATHYLSLIDQWKARDRRP